MTNEGREVVNGGLVMNGRTDGKSTEAGRAYFV